MADLTQVWDMPKDNKSVISWGATLTARSAVSAKSDSGMSLGGGVNRAANEARRRQRKAAQLRLIKNKTRNVYSASAGDFRPKGLGSGGGGGGDGFPSHGTIRGGGAGSVSSYEFSDAFAATSQSTGARKAGLIKAHQKGVIRTPLMRAAAKGDVEEVRALIDARVDLFEEDHRGRTALDWARVSLLPECKACAKVLAQAMRHFVEARAMQNKLVLQQEKLEVGGAG